VIAQIKGQNPVARREVLGDRPPIPAGTEQPMQDRNRRPCAVFCRSKLDGHVVFLWLVR
jgi:hypothetical protein